LPVADHEILASRQEMTISRDAFLRSLPAAVGNVAFSVDGDQIRPLDPKHGWRIVATPLPDLRIALIRLPRQRVEIFLAGFDEVQTKRFLERFELYFRRAGG
jgi:hypothetical protein